MINNIIHRVNDDRIDELESTMVNNFPPVECPLIHKFTKGMYIREIFMPKDSLITSKIHNTNHPFVVSQGSVAVAIDGDNWQEIQAPYTGITQAGTRRVLIILEDTTWVTFHPLPYITGDENEFNDDEKLKLVEKIEDEILSKYDNLLLYKKQDLLKD